MSKAVRVLRKSALSRQYIALKDLQSFYLLERMNVMTDDQRFAFYNYAVHKYGTCRCPSDRFLTCVCSEDDYPGEFPLYCIGYETGRIEHIIHPEDVDTLNSYFFPQPNQSDISDLVASINNLIEEIKWNPNVGALAVQQSKRRFVEQQQK